MRINKADIEDRVARARILLEQDPTIGRFRLAEQLGCTPNQAHHVLNILRSEKPETQTGTPVPAESYTETGDSISISLPKARIHTLQQLIEYYEIDTNIWECESFVANKWEMGAVGDDGRIMVEPLYQIKARFKKRKTVEEVSRIIASIVEDAKQQIDLKFPQPLARKGKRSGVMVEISIADLHAAKLSHHEETGEDYDLKIATQRFKDAVAHIVADVSHRNPEHICLVLGNDLFQSDNPESTTYRGTRVDVDTRYHKAFREVLNMTRDAILYLRQMAPVTVKMVPGNHDTMSVFHLGIALDCWFHNDKHVVIDNSPMMRKYIEWGVNMIMLTHGDKGRKSNFPLLMATEQPEMFGRTKIREVHLGHWHKVGADETNGVVVRVLPSLCSPDAWHSSMGFVGNIKRAEAYLFDKQLGLVGTSIYSVLGDRKDAGNSRSWKDGVG